MPAQQMDGSWRRKLADLAASSRASEEQVIARLVDDEWAKLHDPDYGWTLLEKTTLKRADLLRRLAE